MEPCEHCNDTGYIWKTDKNGKSWMCDCDNDDCNAFGQFDDVASDDASQSTTSENSNV